MEKYYAKNNESDLLKDVSVSYLNFRANFIIDAPEYEEDKYRKVSIMTKEGKKVSYHFHGHNQRCSDISINLEKQKRNFDKEPYAILALYRTYKSTKRPLFGTFMHLSEVFEGEENVRVVRVGDDLVVEEESEDVGVEFMPSEL